jgi:TonB-linked SusC/RagA family outer membrane protein
MRSIACRNPLRLRRGTIPSTHSGALLTLLLSFSFSISAFAVNNAQNITLSETNAPLNKIFKEVHRQTGYTFVYMEAMLRKSKNVSINVSNSSLEQVLDICFHNQPLTYTILNKMIIVKEKDKLITTTQAEVLPPPPPPPVTINGRIVSTGNEPLVGASITEKGTSNTILTKEDGTFSITVSKPNVLLVVSYVGYVAREIRAGSQPFINISLERTNVNLNDVVVVGYGTQKRKDLTGSVASVGSRDIKDLAVTRVDQALSGRVAGVQVKTVSGQPGAAPDIRVRGVGSISAGVDPLYVVDGFPTDNIQTLNPNDIESMDVLKDASATAIYGSRGSNGVIIINTKRGRAGKAQLSFDTYYGWQKVLRLPKMMNSLQQAQFTYDGYRNNNLDVGNDFSGPANTWKIPVAQEVLDVLSGKNTYDQDALKGILRTAPTNEYSLSASGGSDNIRYMISGEYLNQDGIVRNSNLKRYSVRSNIDAKVSSRLSVRFNMNAAFNDLHALPTYTGSYAGGIIGGALNTFNWIPLLDSKGNYTNEHGRIDLSEIDNPLAVANEVQSRQKTMRFLGNVSAEYPIWDELKFNVMLGGNVLNVKSSYFKPQLPVFTSIPAVGSDSAAMITNWVAEYTLNYNKRFGKHQVTGLAGYTAQKERGEVNSLTSNRYPNNLVPSLSAVSGLITGGSSSIYEWSLISYLGRINYNYDGKYYLTASLRSDGSSRFGGNNKYAMFPSFALAWRFRDENFMRNMDFVTDAKLRASYGRSGNNNIGNYQSFATLNYIKYVLGNAAIGGSNQANLENPSLTWEKQQQVNLGIDLAFFNNRIFLTVDHFRSSNTNLLLNVNVPSSTGFSTSLQNIGEVRNTGWEFVLSTVNIKSDFKWTTDFNISTYRNKVVRLGPQGDPIYTANNVTMIGQPIGMFYGLKTNGIFRTAAELTQGPVWNPGGADQSRVGDRRFVDVSGPNGKPDGIISSADYTIIGSPYPDFYYGMSNRFSYKNFDLTVNLQGTQGNKIYNLSRNDGNSGRGRLRGYTFNNDYWKSEQDPGDGKTPRPNNAPTGGTRAIGEQFLDNGSFLRINSIVASYTLPTLLVQRWKLNSLRFYINLSNPFLFTKYTSFNPDVNLVQDPLSPGNEQNAYPLPKSLVLGLNLNF